MSEYLESVGSIAPRRFGIDEFYLPGKQRCVITDLESGLVLMVFNHENKAAMKVHF